MTSFLFEVFLCLLNEGRRLKNKQTNQTETKQTKNFQVYSEYNET